MGWRGHQERGVKWEMMDFQENKGGRALPENKEFLDPWV